jgi:hypothetical protein
MEFTTILRYLGNVILLIGYFVLLNFDLGAGIIIKCIGGLFTIPFAIHYKLWDVVLMSGFFGVMEIHKLIQILSK